MSEQPVSGAAQNASKPATADANERAKSNRAASATAKSTAQRGASRSALLLTFCLALAALGLAGYLFYELTYRLAASDKIAQLEERSNTLEGRLYADLEDLREQLAEQQLDFEASSKQAVEEQWNAILNSIELRVDTAAADAAMRVPNGTAWHLYAIEHLLRVANIAVIYERDAAAAAKLLASAEQMLVTLQENSDLGLERIRTQILSEISALETVPLADTEDLFMRLEAVKRQLPEIAMYQQNLVETVRLDQPEPPSFTSETPFFSRLITELQSFVRISDIVQQEKPEIPISDLLAGPQAVILKQLQATAAQAQLALLQGQEAIFHASLDSMAAIIEQNLVIQDANVATLLEELATLQEQIIAPQMPDLSSSLSQLSALIESDEGDK